MPGYEFLTTWMLDAPRERVWEAIRDSERWPEWWRGAVRVVGHASGELGGTGRWRLFEETGSTAVT